MERTSMWSRLSSKLVIVLVSGLIVWSPAKAVSAPGDAPQDSGLIAAPARPQLSTKRIVAASILAGVAVVALIPSILYATKDGQDLPGQTVGSGHWYVTDYTTYYGLGFALAGAATLGVVVAQPWKRPAPPPSPQPPSSSAHMQRLSTTSEVTLPLAVPPVEPMADPPIVTPPRPESENPQPVVPQPTTPPPEHSVVPPLRPAVIAPVLRPPTQRPVDPARESKCDDEMTGLLSSLTLDSPEGSQDATGRPSAYANRQKNVRDPGFRACAKYVDSRIRERHADCKKGKFGINEVKALIGRVKSNVSEHPNASFTEKCEPIAGSDSPAVP
ncbi:MAG: hypothetical protein JNM83_06150 [Myxococcales bacterium]|nr:hypothetical protein [Myxococcales bacterium]